MQHKNTEKTFRYNVTNIESLPKELHIFPPPSSVKEQLFNSKISRSLFVRRP